MRLEPILHDRVRGLEQMIRDLADQHRQIAVNHAELLKMILQLQLQIDELRRPN